MQPAVGSRTRLKGAFSIDVRQLKPDPDQPRQKFPADKLDAMARSIEARGFQQPLKVRPDGQGGYTIIDGEMRYRSSMQLGLNEVPCWVFENETEAKDIFLDQIVANEQRINFQPYEIANAMIRLRDDFDLSPSEIVEETGFSKPMVSKLFAIVEKIEPKVREQMSDLPAGEATLRHLYAISKQPPLKQAGLAKLVIENQLTASETEMLVDRRKREESKSPSTKGGRPRKRFSYKTDWGEVTVSLKEMPGDMMERQLKALASAKRQITSGGEVSE